MVWVKGLKRSFQCANSAGAFSLVGAFIPQLIAALALRNRLLPFVLPIAARTTGTQSSTQTQSHPACRTLSTKHKPVELALHFPGVCFWRLWIELMVVGMPGTPHLPLAVLPLSLNWQQKCLMNLQQFLCALF